MQERDFYTEQDEFKAARLAKATRMKKALQLEASRKDRARFLRAAR